jgi:endonuclease/exonuclease/phosphatase family metal-dependent hydrolase
VVSLAAAVAPTASGQTRVPAETSDLLTSSPLGVCTSSVQATAMPTRSRIVTWNIHAARQAPLDEIADELKAMQADVIALQEVDVGVRRSGFVDQPAALAAALGYHYVFAASIKWDQGDYGLAVFSRWPITGFHRYRLDATWAAEPRIVLEATVCVAGRPLHLYNHHADGRALSRDAGFAALKEIVKGDVGNGVLVLGDFNELANATGVRALLDTGLVDLCAGQNVATVGEGRFDYILADGSLAGLTSPARVWTTDKSDHNAVLADLQW